MGFSRLAVALLATVASSAAIAQSAPTHDYSGLRVEGQGGLDVMRVHLDYDIDGVTHDLASDSKTGGYYGGNVGYDLNMGGFVLGTEASFGESSSRYCVESFGDRDCIKAGREYEAGIRIGKVFGTAGPLVYGKVGYVNARTTFSEVLSDGTGSRAHEDRDGVRFGAGIEQKLANRFYVKGEYRYSHFKDFKATDDDGGTTRLSLDRHQVVGGVGMIF